MPIHDWTRVDAGTFHAFHTAWVTHLSEALNGGVLPRGYYAMPEQHVGRPITDVLTLQVAPNPPPDGTAAPTGDAGGVAVADAPPRVSQRMTATASPRGRRRTIAVRHVTGHRVVALIEIVSPANKDRPSHVADLATKVASALAAGVHVLLVDLLPPGPHDLFGMHWAVWEEVDPDATPERDAAAGTLTFAAYAAGPEVEAYVEQAGVGGPLPDMPLFLHPERYVNAPLGASYDAAFRGLAAFWREVLEGRGP